MRNPYVQYTSKPQIYFSTFTDRSRQCEVQCNDLMLHALEPVLFSAGFSQEIFLVVEIL